jgi:fumarate hydratase class II
MREESDSLGTVSVPEGRLWGAQTQRSLENFPIGQHPMPKELILALISIKHAAALANFELGLLDGKQKQLIIQAITSLSPNEILNEFPLTVWQTGSGTQSNMNVNEVIANKANELAGFPLGSKSPIHPNDHVNKSQSSNDVFPTAMHIAFAQSVTSRLLPALRNLHAALLEKASQFFYIIKVGRTHFMDAVPIRLGQEFSGYATQIEHAIDAIQSTLPRVYELALGGTAVGTGINCPKGFKEKAIAHLANKYELPFCPAENLFEALACHDTAVELSGALKRLGCALFKIANDLRLMASGPRCAIGEIHLPENEPGSSIMPGKINPTQCEAVTQVVCQVFGNDATIGFAGSQGHLELNVFKPVIAKNCLESILLLADVSKNFLDKCIATLSPNEDRIQYLLEQSLMLATALSQKVGYDAAAKIALAAAKENITLREAAMRSGLLTEQEFLELTNPEKMV